MTPHSGFRRQKPAEGAGLVTVSARSPELDLDVDEPARGLSASCPGAEAIAKTGFAGGLVQAFAAG